MSDDNKTFKSKTIELFGKHYEAKHTSSASLNNRFFIIFGFIKYYCLKFYNNKFIPLMNSFGFQNISDFYAFVLICCFFYLLIGFIFVMITAETDYSEQINSCITNGCSIIEEHCKNKDGTILRDCIVNYTDFLPIVKVQYYSYNEWVIYIIIRLFLGIFIINLLFNFACYLYNKMFFHVTKFYNQIPEMEETV